MACSSPFYLDDVRDFFGRLIQISCRKCMCCRQDLVNHWSNRATYEQTHHASNVGVSLTYNDFWLGIECVNPGYRHPSLRKVHLQRFIDTIRHRVKKLPAPLNVFSDFSWFASGEYGSKKGRPHLHIAFYGLPAWLAKKLCGESWHYGTVKVRPLKFGHVNYFLKYVLEDKIDKSHFMNKYFVRGMEFPFYSHSKGFGKGLYYEHRLEIGKDGCMYFGDRVVSVPSYWKNKLMYFTDEYVENRDKLLKERQQKDFEQNGSDYYSYKDMRAMRIIGREHSLIDKATRNMRPVPVNIRFRTDVEMYSRITSPPVYGRRDSDKSFEHSLDNDIFKRRLKLPTFTSR